MRSVVARLALPTLLALTAAACHVPPGAVTRPAGPVVVQQAPPPANPNSAAVYAPGRSNNPPPGHGGVPPGQAKKGTPVAWEYGHRPPWVPPAGKYNYRKKHRGTYYGYQAPFGIARNACYREELGRALGGIAGAAAGYQFGSGAGKTAAVIGGTIIGVMVGGHIGRSMDEIDQNCIGQILEHAPPQTTVSWNDAQGSRYQVTPAEPYADRDGRYCREYQTTATIGGQVQQVYGTACRQPDGAWQIVN